LYGQWVSHRPIVPNLFLSILLKPSIGSIYCNSRVYMIRIRSSILYLFSGVSYLLILIQVYQSEKKLFSVKGKPGSAMRTRVTRMVAVLVLCFVICWLPHQAPLLLKIEGKLSICARTWNWT